MMTRFKHMLSALLVCSLISGKGLAKTYTKKTFLAPRPVGFNYEMEYTTWHNHVYKKREDKSHRTHLMATGFYQASQNNSGLAKYFGAGNPCDCPIRKGFNVGPSAVNSDREIVTPVAPADPTNFDIAADLLVDMQNTTRGGPNVIHSTLQGKVCLRPEQETWGVRLDYFQDVFHPFDKLYFKASLPIVNVHNDMNMSISDGRSAVLGAGSFSLADFLAGRLDNTNINQPTPAANDQTLQNADMLKPLCKAKIDCKGRDKTGVADLDLSLGYKFKDTEKSHIFGHIVVTIPLGTRTRGEYIFEPIVGNGRHWGLGGGIDAGAEVWRNKKANLRFLASLNYRYLFENCEVRTPGIKCFTFGHYYALGKKGQIDKPFCPAANVLTQEFNVRPGHMFDGLVALAFHSSRFTLDLGYSLFFKDDESITAKNKLCVDDYGIAAPAASTVENFDATVAINERFLTQSDLDLDVIKTPWQLTHKIFAGIGYTGKIYKKYPASLGIGGSYEFATDNSALENAAVWLKAAFSF